MRLKIRRYFMILLVLCVLCGGFYVTQKYTHILDNLFGRASELDAPGERVTGDIDAARDSMERSGESLGRLDDSLGVVRDSAQEVERGIESLEGRATELEARNREIEEGFRGIRDAESRGRQAVQLGREANQRLEAVIRRLSEESGETGETEEGVENDLDY